ncbi:hypothetical protein TanjilG_32610 [Lupinus angustifolius]|uniref:TF-B3 domain-containing protein n=1 Tax=Lupinus angustifolius TaxID=3871 RepID=A0A4P1R855_LUPAN|nr:PREDICTED: putative B3 domain-containing protein At5g58280 [Lupinus angustifolius]XP_019454447.1 PREDICTED: putative B3 domain-containing protein At5g58280 [Lupinus angustifolius]XP_019454448.1 PREDICTED: putative B3 domain-containing protein At5g58280 [Lupinus angustifolius]XP_019454449.1 PREDICTED: putative B3 domain-containing protein At5g58280 [Lupinus angustifolius]XP_019454450.1 PREDICTED: putative B3 domain-containing protein At5g58280 [Lupinus angustifolius]OIW04418.1 hypothetical p
MAKGCANNTYEEARKQRLEENKKRFEDLGISKISKTLTEVTTPVKKTHHHLPKSKSKSNDLVEPRRSSRTRNPIASYSEEAGIDLPTLRKRSRSNSSSCYSYIARPLEEIKQASDKQRSRAWEAAEKLHTNLQSENPTFIKSMVRSHVYSCFWLGLPSKFCEEHLPKTHYNMILEDENGSEYEAVYIGSRSGLSGGWRAFALEHKLDDGDALVFELIEPARFKIYTVKAFPDSVEEYEKEEPEEKEGNMRATRALKAGSKGETKSKKTRKSKQAIVVYETNESESSQEHLPQSSIDNEVKAHEISPTKITVSQEKMQEKSKMLATGVSKVEGQVERVKPKGKNLVKPRGAKPGKKQKVTKNLVQDDGELMDVEPVEEASKDDSHVESVKPKANNIVNPRGAKPSKEPKSTDNLVQDGVELEKVEPVEEARKCVSQKPRKKAAGKLFRKRA